MAEAPVSIVIFGITGDLARKKLVPAIFDLYCKGELPHDISLIGYGRKELSPEEFDSLISESIIGKNPSSELGVLRMRQHFIRKCSYVKGELVGKDGYAKLKTKLTKRNIFFLSVHPELHSKIITGLGDGKLLNKQSQIMIEKPFGHNTKTAKALDSKLLKYIREGQIYRIDHYLGKTALLELIERRKNDIDFEKALSDVNEINISIWETKGITRRGAFYDAVGALKDVGQNHILQMVAASIAPKGVLSENARKVQKARARAISSLRLQLPVSRGQYNKYHDEPGVNPNSRTETFFSVYAKTVLNNQKGTGIYLSAGKGLSQSEANIHIVFNKPMMLKEGLVKEVTFYLNRSVHDKPIEAYERIFLGALRQDQSLFCSLEETVAGWKFDEGVRRFWKKHKTPLFRYDEGSNPYMKIASK